MFFSLPSSLSLLSVLLVQLSPHIAAYKPLSDTFLHAIPAPASTLLPPSRVPAQHHIIRHFSTALSLWNLSWQNSTSADLPVSNMIFAREPPWVKPGQSNLLTLVAHYDSEEGEEAVGASECAMLMYVAGVLDAHVSRMYKEMQAFGEGGTVEMDMGVQIVFLDGGEEGLGARALANQWSTRKNLPSAKFYAHKTPLQQISLFMLLSHIGSADPSVPSYFPTTHWAYEALATIESRMRTLNLLESTPEKPFLRDANATAVISDDHVPFLSKGVNVLHVRPEGTKVEEEEGGGNGEEVLDMDLPTARDWSKLVAAFALEWLDMMEVWDEPEPSMSQRR